MHEPGTKRHPMIDMEEFESRLRQSYGNQTEDDPLAEITRLISGQRDLVQRVAEPQGQTTEARQGATSSPEAQGTEAQEPDALQSLDDPLSMRKSRLGVRSISGSWRRTLPSV